MALIWVDNNAHVDSLPRSRTRFFHVAGERLQQVGSSEQEVFDYVANVVDEVIASTNESRVFIRPGFIFPRGSEYWDSDALSRLWKRPPEGIGYDEQNSGNYLGLLIYQYMINSDLTWYCTKTQFNNRDFETAVYWTDEH